MVNRVSKGVWIAGIVLCLASFALGGETPVATCPAEMLVSGFTSGNIHVYDGCTGEHLRNLDVEQELAGAQAIVRGPDGHLYVASESNNRVLRYDGETLAFIDRFVWDDPSTPTVDETGGLLGPTGLAFGPNGHLYVCGFDSDNVLRYDGETGAFFDEIVPAGSGGLNGPDAGMVFGPDGMLYVPSFWTNQVLRYDGARGNFMDVLTAADSRLDGPRVILFLSDDDTVLVSSSQNGRIQRFDRDTGNRIGTFGPLLVRPTGMAFGPDGNLYVTSATQSNVVRLDGQTGSLMDTFVPASLGGLSAGTFVYFHGDEPAPVPAASTWGLVALSIALLILGSLVLNRHRPRARFRGGRAVSPP